jgi:SAM-dependent methyltransferase
LNKIEKLGVKRGRLLDVGCAAGFFLDEARRRGWDAHGCELSAYAHAHATEALRLDVKRSGFLDPAFTPSAESFDVITMFNVLEHIPDPAAVADRLFALLRPGGFLFLETWDPRSLFARVLGSRWPTYAPPTVLYCFTQRTLGQLFDDLRWSPIAYRPAIKWISLDHGLSLLEYEAAHSPFARVVGPLLAAVRRSFLGSVDVPYCLGDLAVAVFQRKARAFHMQWNGAPKRPGTALSTGTPA